MIGWENDRGAYFINKLDERITKSAQDIETLNSDIESVEGSLQTLNSVSSKSYSIAAGNSLTFNKPDSMVLMYVMRDFSSICELFVIDIWGGIKHLIGTSEAITVSISEGTVTMTNNSALAVGVLVQCGVRIE